MEKLGLEKSTVKPNGTLNQHASAKMSGETQMVDLDEKGRLIYEPI